MFTRVLKVIIVCFILLLPLFITESPLAFPQRNTRKIIVFRKDVSESKRDELLAKFEIVPDKNLRFINAKAAHLNDKQLSLLARDPRVLRIDEDVKVFALPGARDREDLCDRFPWLRWCQPTPTPTPSPTVMPTPSLSPSPMPTSTVTPTLEPTISPSSTSTPTMAPTTTPTTTPTATPTTTLPSYQPIPWGVARIGANDAWKYSTGREVKVAILDTGIDRDHPDLDDNLAGCVNLISWWRSCEDDNGHGTHVAGIIGAENNNFGVVGVAPNAQIYAIKVLDRDGSGYLSDIIEGLDWAIANRMQVVNMSLGASSDVPSFKEAVERTAAAGIIQVAAGGNSGPGENTVYYPAAYPQIIAVAATDSSDNIPFWSSRGKELDLSAPGASIYSTYTRGGYKTLSGTSMAAPHVTGVVALRLSLHPGESPIQIETILESNTDHIPYNETIVGAGLVNALKSVSVP